MIEPLFTVFEIFSLVGTPHTHSHTFLCVFKKPPQILGLQNQRTLFYPGTEVKVWHSVPIKIEIYLFFYLGVESWTIVGDTQGSLLAGLRGPSGVLVIESGLALCKTNIFPSRLSLRTWSKLKYTLSCISSGGTEGVCFLSVYNTLFLSCFPNMTQSFLSRAW